MITDDEKAYQEVKEQVDFIRSTAEKYPNLKSAAVLKSFEIALDSLRDRIARQNPQRLTLEELRKMDGDPVWVSDISEWAIVSVDSVGRWAGVPFVNGDGFNWDVEARGLKCYRTKPNPPEAT